MELWLIRHGLPLRIDGGDGPADPALAPEGVEQAELMAQWWSRHPIDAIYASPMNRAHQTALPLAAATGLDLQLDDGLKEFDAHLNFYVPLEELRADEAAWNKMVEEWLSPEAEAGRQAFRAGVITTIDAIVERHQDQRVALVCHGGVINAYLSDILSLPGTMWFEPAYTSVSRAVAVGSHKQVVSLNESPHLPNLPVPTPLG
ncbi:histidine phosphatase family protein [Aquihabitans sp. McL0605]|uniref:histidine phosphatase family protein n=1 Tax=Aquihabitans sp. McL0605 TaxID=3415671 RepID=UPI003CE8EF5A